ncbi:MAG: hypothetical protein ABEK04_02670 [Candidatus Nanohalobium sp.]
MQLTVASIMQRAMANPDLVVLGLLAGFILAKLHSRRSGMGGMGGL